MDSRTDDTEYEQARCILFDSGSCGSCSLLACPPSRRRSSKLSALQNILSTSGLEPLTLEPLVSPDRPWGSRTKVKMIVSGTAVTPIVGILDEKKHGIDLCRCPLHSESVRDILQFTKSLFGEFAVPPYNLETRRGEVKGVMVMSNHGADQTILRIVLRSSESIPRLRKAVPRVRAAFPQIKVVSCNIQPIHAAIPEGSEEIVLTDESTITEDYSGTRVHFGPQSFMQVTHQIAEKLYARCARLTADIRPRSLVDLYCGVGGFSLTSARSVDSVIGVEISENAVACASRAAEEQEYSHLSFLCEDAETWYRETDGTFEAVITNPPRRGLSQGLIEAIKRKAPHHLIYSSCNPETLCRDISQLSRHYSFELAAPFDMFPLTDHLEVLAHLRRR